MGSQDAQSAELLDLLDQSSRALVLLYKSDDLGASALSSIAECSDLLRGIDIYTCCIKEQEDAKLLQVSKLPQFRFYRRGTEVGCLVGNHDLDVLYSNLSEFLGLQI